jgi:hypothetical protein
MVNHSAAIIAGTPPVKIQRGFSIILNQIIFLNGNVILRQERKK